MRWLFITAFWLLVCIPIIVGLTMTDMAPDARLLISMGVGALAAAAGQAIFR